MTPVKHFAINLGAPSDMRDDDGTLWFGYPNPKTVYSKNHFPHYGVKFDLKEETLPDMGYFCNDSEIVRLKRRINHGFSHPAVWDCRGVKYL